MEALGEELKRKNAYFYDSTEHKNTTQQKCIEYVYTSEFNADGDDDIDDVESANDIVLLPSRMTLKIHTMHYVCRHPTISMFQTLKHIFSNYICKLVTLSLLIGSISAAVFYGGYLAILEGNKMKAYSESFTIEGNCRCTHKWQSESEACITNHAGSENCHIKITFHYRWQIMSLEPCADNDNAEFTSTEEEDEEGDLFQIADEVTCYTNERCDKVFVTEPNTFPAIVGWIYFGAAIVFLLAFIFCCACLYGFCHFWQQVKEYCSDTFCLKFYKRLMYEFDIDKAKHFLKQWKHEMSDEQRLDYFLSYYCRQYGNIHLNESVYDLALQYVSSHDTLLYERERGTTGVYLPFEQIESEEPDQECTTTDHGCTT